VTGRSGRPRLALTVLAAGFVLSAGLRAGVVVAALPDSLSQTVRDGFGNPLAQSENAAPRERTDVLVAELREKRAKLAQREQTLDTRAQSLEAIEERLRSRLDDLSRAQRELERTAALVDDAAGRDVRHLAEMYQTMKPKQAATIFDRMEPSFAAGFLAEMDANAAAQILAGMEADKAYAVSLLLATRNVDREVRGR